MKALTREQSQELDRKTIDEFGMPSLMLMENAARWVSDEAQRLIRAHSVSMALARLGQPGSRDDHPRNLEELETWKESLSKSDRPIAILCGPGNNGGDGLAVARTLHNRGFDVLVFYVGDIERVTDASDDVRTNQALLNRLGIEVIELNSVDQIRDAENDIAQSVVIIDAMFGTGLTRTLDEPWRQVIDIVNQSDASVLSIDVPSGLCTNTGVVMGDCVRADVTVTFTLPKIGFSEGAGETMTGEVKVAEIGIPRYLIEQATRDSS